MRRSIVFSVFLGLMMSCIAWPARSEIKAGSSELNLYVGGFIGLDKSYFEEDIIPYDFEDMASDPGTGVVGGMSLTWNFTPYIGIEGGMALSSADFDAVYYIDEQEIKGEEIGASLGGSEFMGYTNLVLHLLPESRIVPFLTGGVGFMHLWGTAEANGYEEDWSETHFCANWGGGVKIFVSETWLFRINVRNFNLKLEDSRDRFNWLEVSGGISFLF
ncbi:MAG: hypothetical protein DRP81_06020 [Candidatus Omnitrophota bacterium]|nr:MAG: hypothetical protein DRP81_06020 [Candidatus Omnitrophota bacterium]